MEPVPQTDDEARPAAQPTPQILGRRGPHTAIDVRSTFKII